MIRACTSASWAGGSPPPPETAADDGELTLNAENEVRALPAVAPLPATERDSCMLLSCCCTAFEEGEAARRGG